MKTIKIEDSLWKKLMRLKKSLDLHNMTEVIESLEKKGK